MQFHRQLNGHVPSIGLIGDCFRTCIACFMNLEPSDVPNFTAIYYSESRNEEMNKAYQSWLAERGLTLVTLAYGHDGEPQELINSIGRMNGSDFTYMLTGSCRGSNHVCIYRGNELLWDPSNTGGLTGPIDGHYWMEILASLRCRT